MAVDSGLELVLGLDGVRELVDVLKARWERLPPCETPRAELLDRYRR
jgi:hypothetical protein